MKTRRRFLLLAGVCGAVLLGCLGIRVAWAYVEAPYTLGRVIQEATQIALLRVEKVDKQRNLILYRKVQDLKGPPTPDVVKHNIGQGGFHPREWQTIMACAEPGQTAVFFNNGSASETCLANYWYQAYSGGEWWNMSHAEPYFLRSFAGRPEKLATVVAAIIAGQEVVVPCMVDGDKNALALRTARVQRMKASLKLQDYNVARDFVGWGGEDFRVIAGMPGFGRYASLTRSDPEAAGISSCDFDGDGKPDLCLVGTGKVTLLSYTGTSLNEVVLPGATGARSADWADYNGDGKIDLLLATPGGPMLFKNEGSGRFENDSAGLPRLPYFNVAAAAWIDYDGDKLPDILVANGFLGLSLYRNRGPAGAEAGAKGPALFEDISEQVGLGVNGVAGDLKGDHLAVADVNGDGRADFLYSAGSGVLVFNTPRGFVAHKDSGLKYRSGKVSPVFGDFNGDKKVDLFVPQAGGCRLFKNDGTGRFADVTAGSGALARPIGEANCAVWTDFGKSGRLDLLVGCLNGPNRFFRSTAAGAFVDATNELGLEQKVFNTRGVLAVDLNGDGVMDVVFNNEGQESGVFLGKAAEAVVGRR